MAKDGKAGWTNVHVKNFACDDGVVVRREREPSVAGLELQATAGKKTWRLHYTRRSDKRRRVYVLGEYPETSVAEARAAAVTWKSKIKKEGADPASDAVERRESITFRQLADQRLAHDSSIGTGTKRNYRQHFDADVFAAFGNVPACEVTPDMVARLLDTIEKRGAPVHADRARAAIGSTFKWAIKRRLANVVADPTAGLGKRASSTARTRVLCDDELARLWHATASDHAPITRPMGLIFRLAIVTGQRRTEVAGAITSELRLDGLAPTWTIPGDTMNKGRVVKGRTKNRRDQILPLSRQAADLFRQAVEASGGGKYVFPADTAHVKSGRAPRTPHIHGESVSKAVRRLRATFDIDDVTLHDMRRSIATWLGEEGTLPDVIDRVLNHTPRDVTGRHYNHATMLPMVRHAMQAWADHIDGIISTVATEQPQVSIVV